MTNDPVCGRYIYSVFPWCPCTGRLSRLPIPASFCRPRRPWSDCSKFMACLCVLFYLRCYIIYCI